MNLLIRVIGRWFRRKLLSWRFALFILPWVVVLANTELRTTLSVHLLGSHLMFKTYPWSPERDAYNYDDWPFAGSRILEAHPRNFNAKVLAASELPTRREHLAALDSLIVQYPNAVFLLIDRIERSDLRYYDARARSDSKILPTINMPGVLRAMELARLGRKREPGNAYFDWKLAECLLLTRRDAEALTTLHNAASKPYFDMHRRDRIRARHEAFALVRPLLIEEKINNAIWSLRYPPGRYAPLLWHAGRAKRQGNHVQALQIYGDLLHMFVKIRDNRDGSEVLRGLSDILNRAIQGTPGELARVAKHRKDTPGAPISWDSSQVFIEYARQHGREDLAQLVIREEPVTQRLETRSYDRSIWQYPQVISQYQHERVEHLRLLSITVGVCFLFVLIWRWLLGLVLWSPGLKADSGCACDRLRTSVVFIALMAGAVWLVWPHSLFFTERIFPKSVVTTAATLLPVVALLAAAVGAIGAVYRHRARLLVPGLPEPRDSMLPPNRLPFTINVLSGILVAAGVVCWVVVGFVAISSQQRLSLSPLTFFAFSPTTAMPTLFLDTLVAWAAGLSMLCYAGWLFRWRWMMSNDFGPVARGVIATHLKSLSDCCVFLGYLYLFVTLTAQPIRREADASLEGFLQQGQTPRAQTAKLQQENTP